MAPLEVAARRALDGVFDPELDEPITDLGFVGSLEVADGTVTVHLRLPTSFCAPNFAYLMASDAKDALTPLARHVVVLLDDHHDSDIINRGLAADAGYRGTFGPEADQDLDELRLTFRRKAHTRALLSRRTALGLDVDPTARVLVDDHGTPYPREEIPLRLRFARSVRISIDGNAHFCRGLLRTRYPESAADQTPREPDHETTEAKAS